jgi:hypothetical protein
VHSWLAQSAIALSTGLANGSRALFRKNLPKVWL